MQAQSRADLKDALAAKCRASLAAADGAHAALKAATSATPADLAAMTDQISRLKGEVAAAMAELAQLADQVDKVKAPRSWSFQVIRDHDGRIAELVARPT